MERKFPKRLNVKSLIALTGRTQRQIGIDAKIPECILSGFINGRVELKDDDLRSLAQVLGVPVDILFGDPSKMSIAATK